MSSNNDITGDVIQSRSLSKQGRDNWDNIFGVKKPAWEWLKEVPHISILDHDGWRHDDGVTLENKITREDFNYRLSQCTVMTSDWLFEDQRQTTQ